ncbi:hypothetical protein VV01_13790 [Luteipulveratus halotolerans]|uniref:Uncharacterized protein n=1 Tax=Luteipulveratus halotolerans TaxID=1631356 RepID=A0A0L6CJM2_9MICO|nr:hypothetical protein VV01_13790 [Luteipulveratus halotolerans]
MRQVSIQDMQRPQGHGLARTPLTAVTYQASADVFLVWKSPETSGVHPGTFGDVTDGAAGRRTGR